ncbi:PAS domain S-box protein [Hippea maritima]|uniref:PAS sensor protein n=1 Tax=Hippea maritima (strain ATCC 700847 / DSM 10411 / MH2) TaxID=760142 RepID=F2LUD7_HIPMA|nr:PAS domain-containing protein [Hippea maritima]AEA33463.1 PAS sensor protein [Hippea maritima DSM 10411]
MQNSEIVNAIKDSTIIGIYVYEEKGKIIFVNETFKKLTGYTEEELIGKVAADLIEGPEKKLALYNIAERLKGKRFSSKYSEIHFKTKEGFLKPAIVFAHTITHLGKPFGLVMVIDKTQEKAYEKLFLP